MSTVRACLSHPCLSTTECRRWIAAVSITFLIVLPKGSPFLFERKGPYPGSPLVELRVCGNFLLNYIQPSREVLSGFPGQQHFLYPNCCLFLKCSTHGHISIWCCQLTAHTIHVLSAPAWSRNCHLNPFSNTATFWVWNSLHLSSFWLYLVHTVLAFLLSYASLWSLIPGVCMNGLLSSTIFDPDPVLNLSCFCQISESLCGL